jgi:very-short-patch-repair endonuclease
VFDSSRDAEGFAAPRPLRVTIKPDSQNRNPDRVSGDARADARRDAALARGGYRVLRLDAALVARDIEAAIARMSAALGL